MEKARTLIVSHTLSGGAQRAIESPALGAMAIADAMHAKVYPYENPVELLPNFLHKKRFNIVGFSTFRPSADRPEQKKATEKLVDSIEKVRGQKPGMLIMLGGHGVTTYPEQFMKNTGAHIGVLGVHGEAIATGKELAKKLPKSAVKNGELTKPGFNALMKIPGLVVKYNGELHWTGEREPPAELPVPSYKHEVGGGQHFAYMPEPWGVIAVFAERALCEKSLSELACIYCQPAHSLQRIEKKSLRNMTQANPKDCVQAIKNAVGAFRRKRKGKKPEKFMIGFHNDAMPIGLMEGILEEIREAPSLDLKKMQMGFMMRPDQLSPENMEKLIEMNGQCNGINITVGMEFANENEIQGLRRAKKGSRYEYPADIKERLLKLYKSGVNVSTFHIMTSMLTDYEGLKRNLELLQWCQKNLRDTSSHAYLEPRGLLLEKKVLVRNFKFKVNGKEWEFPDACRPTVKTGELKKMIAYLEEKRTGSPWIRGLLRQMSNHLIEEYEQREKEEG
ncbi:hypothetical protein ACFLQ2_02980 [archaeon]